MEDLPVSELMEIQSHKGIYTIEFDDACIERFAEWDLDKTHFIVDRKVCQLYPEQLQTVLDAPSVLLLDALETNKSLEKLSDYVEFLVDKNIRRNHTLVAIGGGIMQDISSFLGATLLRGVEWVFYPTTLLSQADSCIGSKSSINCRGTKNILGTFTPPQKIYLSTQFLRTLELRELKSGVGEMLKVHAIAGPSEFQSIATDYDELFSDSEMMMKRIRKSLEIKKEYIEKDEFDKGPRLVFNYGHSFGHAIEAATNFAIPHGIAVSIGCDMANYCAYRLGIGTESNWRNMRHTFKANYDQYETVDIPFDSFLSALGKDKKNEGSNSFSLILPDKEANVFKDSYPNNQKLRGFFKDFLTGLKI
jgi:3-dehydroquinate synthase